MRITRSTQFLRLGITGLAIGMVLNLVAWLFFHRHAAEYFSSAWWTTWFPSYLVWFIFAVMGLVGRLRG